VVVGPSASLFAAYVGPFAAIAEKVTIGAVAHKIDTPTNHGFHSSAAWGLAQRNFAALPCTRVGPDAWIGTGAIVRSGIRVGCGAVVGAGSVVTRDVEDYEIVVGVPARRLQMRFPDDVIARLLRLSWWDWPAALLKEHVELFRTPLTPAVLDALESARRPQRLDNEL
jgi:acetyltransferase-like isoleucine patch superfamily enzyme